MDAKSLMSLFKTVATVSDFMPLTKNFAVINDQHTVLLGVELEKELIDIPDKTIDVGEGSKIKFPKSDVELIYDNATNIMLAKCLNGIQLNLKVYEKTSSDPKPVKVDYGSPSDKIEIDMKAFRELVSAVKGYYVTFEDDEHTRQVKATIYDDEYDRALATSIVGIAYTYYNFKGIYHVNYLKKIIKLMPNKVEAHIMKNLPIEFYWTDEKCGASYKYLVAPRIMNE